MKKKIAVIGIAVAAVCALTAGIFAMQGDETEMAMRIATNFSYTTIDPHEGNSSWYNGVYGLTENLFRISDDCRVEPCLAKEGVMEKDTWTITLQDNLVFSNGKPVTPEMVIRNLQRSGEVNPKSVMNQFTFQVLDDTRFQIICDGEYPTLLNTLASPGYAIADLDATTDFEHDLVATGPYVIRDFRPNEIVSVAKNENYWGGEVGTDRVDFYYMQDDDAKLMAMQNGEIDAYTGVTAAAKEIYEKDTEAYQVVTLPATRLQFYILNQNRLDQNVRGAINRTIDSKAMEAYLKGTVTATDGPFSSMAAYGKVTKPAVDTTEAKTLLEEAGYRLNEKGRYERDGQELNLTIAYYASRSLDALATLMQEQLAAIGVSSTLVCEEDPDATYMETADFDIALYCSIADMTGDPEYFLRGLVTGSYTVGGFQNDRCEELLEQLSHEADTAKRAKLANEITQILIDEDAYGFLALFNKITVLKQGVSGYSETSPFDFYGIGMDTKM